MESKLEHWERQRTRAMDAESRTDWLERKVTADHLAKRALRRQRDVAIWIAAISIVALLVKVAV